MTYEPQTHDTYQVKVSSMTHPPVSKVRAKKRVRKLTQTAREKRAVTVGMRADLARMNADAIATSPNGDGIARDTLTRL